jgi:hypothetical protein
VTFPRGVLIPVLCALFAWAMPHVARASGLPAAPGGATVTEVPATGALHLYVTGDRPGLVKIVRGTDGPFDPEPACTARGLAVLAPDHHPGALPEPAPGDDAWVDWLRRVCLTLELAPPDLPPGPARRADDPPGKTWRLSARGVDLFPVYLDADGRLGWGTWPLRPLHVVVFPFLVLLLRALPRPGTTPAWREAWALAAAAIAVRLALAPERVLLAGDEPFQQFVGATGLDLAPTPHGGAWPALLGPFWLALGGPTTLPQGANLVASVLTVLLLRAFLDAAFGPTAARVGAWMLVAMPLPVAVSRTETMYPVLTMLQVAAALGIARRDREGAWLTAASAVLLGHLRPYALLFGAAVLALLARRRVDRAAVAAGAIGLTAAAIGAMSRLSWPTGGGGVEAGDLTRLLQPGFLVGPGGSLALTDPFVTPVAVTALAVGALMWTPRGQRAAPALLAAALGLGTLPYLHLGEPQDVARYQLPAQIWAIALAAAAWPHLGHPSRSLWRLALLLSWIVARAPLGGASWSHNDEIDVLRRALIHTPEDAVVRYRTHRLDAWEPVWVQLQQRGAWRPLDDAHPLAAGEWRWLSEADAGRSADPCRLRAVVDDAIDVWPPPSLPSSPAALTYIAGMYRVLDCDDANPPMPSEPAPR